MNRRYVVMAVLFGIMLMAAGCSKKSSTYDAEYINGALSVDASGKVEVTYTEDFDEDVYNKDELKTAAMNEVDEFNSKYSTDDGMSFVSLEVKKDKAKLKMSFKTVDDYLLYNENYVDTERKIKLFVGTYKEAVAAGYDIKGKMFELGVKKKKSISIDDITDIDKMNVIYTTQGTSIVVDGNIKYISKHIVVKKNVAITEDKSQNFVLYLPKK